nr:eukaryotic translation initiation factor 3 subunit F-like [Lytechinus pictus]
MGDRERTGSWRSQGASLPQVEAIFDHLRVDWCEMRIAQAEPSTQSNFASRLSPFFSSFNLLHHTCNHHSKYFTPTTSYNVVFKLRECGTVAVDMEFAKNMFELHKKVNSWENIVGWYATGREITGHSVLIHDYYSRECQNPIHVTVDTTMADLNMSVKTWVRQNMGVPDKSQGTVFIPIPKKIAFHQPEKVAMDAFIRETDPNRKTIELTTDLQYVSKASGNLQEMLTRVLQYVDDILTGKTSADNQIGRFLMNLVSNVPKLQPEEFDQMLNNSMKDLLMVVYLSGLIETQLTLNEKLTLSKAANSV